MKICSLLGLIVILSSCTGGYPLKSVDYNDLFTDGNSKVWVINKMVVKGVDVAPHGPWNKEALVFHQNGTVQYIPLKGIGHVLPIRGTFYLDSQNKHLEIEFGSGKKRQSWYFDLSRLERDKIRMKASKDSDVQFLLELTPFPEL